MSGSGLVLPAQPPPSREEEEAKLKERVFLGTSCPVRAGNWQLAVPQPQALAGQVQVQVQTGPVYQPCYKDCEWLIASQDGKRKECAVVAGARAQRSAARSLQLIAAKITEAEKEDSRGG